MIPSLTDVVMPDHDVQFSILLNNLKFEFKRRCTQFVIYRIALLLSLSGERKKKLLGLPTEDIISKYNI